MSVASRIFARDELRLLMKYKRNSERMIAVLNKVESDSIVNEVTSRHGINSAAYNN